MNRLIPIVLFAGACNVVDAPENLEELVVFGFVQFDDDPSGVATAEGLLPLTDTLAEELTTGFRVSAITFDELIEAGVPAEEGNPIVGVSATVQMDSSVDDVAVAWSFPRMQEVLEVTLDFRIDSEDGELDCFLSHECDTYAYDGWRQNDIGFLGESEQVFRREYRWLTLEDDSVILATRDIVPEPAVMSGNVFRLNQQYSYTLIFPNEDGGSTRMDTFWVDAEVIGIELPDYFALDTAVNNMQNTAEQVDAFTESQ